MPERGLVVLIALAAALGIATQDWPADNRIEVWARGEGGSPTRTLDEQFGGDRWVVLRWSRAEAVSAPETDWLADLEGAIRREPVVRRLISAFSLPGAPLEGRPWSAGERPLAQRLCLVQHDPPRLVTLLGLAPDASSPATRGFAEKIPAWRTAAEAAGWQLEAAGHPLIAAALDAQAARVETLFAPLLALVAFLGLAFIWRSLRLAAWTVLPAVIAVLSWRGALILLQWPSNLVLVAGAPVILVIVTASLVHLVVGVRRAVAGGMLPPDAVRHAVTQKRRPAQLAALTTALGFLVFLTSDVEPVRRLGLTAGCAVFFAVPLAWSAVARGLSGAGSLPAARALSTREWGRVGRPGRGSRSLAFIGVGVLGLAVWPAWTGLRLGLDAIEYFPRGHALRQQYSSLEAAGVPLSTADILVRREAPWPSAALASLPPFLEAEADRVIGPDLILADARAALGAAALALQATTLRAADRLSADGRWARWTVVLEEGDLAALRESVAQLERAARDAPLFSGAEIRIEGTVQGLIAVQEHLVGTLLRSLGLTLSVSALLFLFVVQGLRQWIVALIANLAPVASVLVAMAVLEWPLDAASVMVAAVVMGIAVDNTVHYLAARREFARDGRTRGELETAALQRVGAAATTSSLVLAAGFAALLFANFAPTSRFGALTAVGCLVALGADLWLLPALLHRPAKG